MLTHLLCDRDNLGYGIIPLGYCRYWYICLHVINVLNIIRLIRVSNIFVYHIQQRFAVIHWFTYYMYNYYVNRLSRTEIYYILL